MGVFDLHRKDYPFFWPGMGGGGVLYSVAACRIFSYGIQDLNHVNS